MATITRIRDGQIIRYTGQHKQGNQETRWVSRILTPEWQRWKMMHASDLQQHRYGLEERFVDTILSEIEPHILSPDDVMTQYHFVDDMGQNRYIDFMIINKERGYCLPIEIDGLTKIQREDKTLNYVKYNDMWWRQNALMTQFGALLRFTNNQVRDYPDKVKEQIVGYLQIQEEAKTYRTLDEQSAKHQMQQAIESVNILFLKNAELNKQVLEQENTLNQYHALLQQYQDTVSMLTQQGMSVQQTMTVETIKTSEPIHDTSLDTEVLMQQIQLLDKEVAQLSEQVIQVLANQSIPQSPLAQPKPHQESPATQADDNDAYMMWGVWTIIVLLLFALFLVAKTHV